MFFITKGNIDIGYEISRKTHYVLRMGEGKECGAYECSFNVKPIFNYMVSSDLTAYTIRKIKWLEHVKDPEFDTIGKMLLHNIEHKYNGVIKDKIIFH